MLKSVLSNWLFRALCCLSILSFSLPARAQSPANPYSVRQLSDPYYLPLRDSIKKKWTCPELYKTKTTQKKYKEFWEASRDFMVKGIDDKDFVCDSLVYPYVASIVTDIAKGNPALINTKPVLLLDRTSAVNAYSIGNDIIVINLGIIRYARYREELALYIAHELSHNILKHSDNSMKEYAELITSDDYKDSLNAVLDSKYDRYSRLKKVMQQYSFGRTRHNRYRESDADSLAVVLLKNAHIPFDARYFLHLDSSDMVYKQNFKQPVGQYFKAYGLNFEDWWTQKRSKGLSAKGYTIKDTTAMEDSMKTHPDCSVRYARTQSSSDLNAALSPVPEQIRLQTTKMMVWNMYCNGWVTGCLYTVLQEKDNGNTDPWYDFMLYNNCSAMLYAIKELNRFRALGVTKREYVSKDYFALQTFLEQVPQDSVANYCTQLRGNAFWQQLQPDARAYGTFTDALNASGTNPDKESFAGAAQQFMSSYPNSMYAELVALFRKK